MLAHLTSRSSPSQQQQSLLQQLENSSSKSHCPNHHLQVLRFLSLLHLWILCPFQTKTLPDLMLLAAHFVPLLRQNPSMYSLSFQTYTIGQFHLLSGYPVYLGLVLEPKIRKQESEASVGWGLSWPQVQYLQLLFSLIFCSPALFLQYSMVYYSADYPILSRSQPLQALLLLVFL